MGKRENFTETDRISKSQYPSFSFSFEVREQIVSKFMGRVKVVREKDKEREREAEKKWVRDELGAKTVGHNDILSFSTFPNSTPLTESTSPNRLFREVVGCTVAS